jgi:hypothetical protein
MAKRQRHRVAPRNKTGKSRDYAAEYLRRIERALQRGQCRELIGTQPNVIQAREIEPEVTGRAGPSTTGYANRICTPLPGSSRIT